MIFNNGTVASVLFANIKCSFSSSKSVSIGDADDIACDPSVTRRPSLW